MSFEADQGRRSRLTDLTIPSGTDVSNFLNEREYGRFDALALESPATFPETAGLEANNDPALAEGDDAQWSTYHPITPGTAVTWVATTNIMYVIPTPPTHGFRLKTTGNVAADRTFKVWGIFYGRS